MAGIKKRLESKMMFDRQFESKVDPLFLRLKALNGEWNHLEQSFDDNVLHIMDNINVSNIETTLWSMEWRIAKKLCSYQTKIAKFDKVDNLWYILTDGMILCGLAEEDDELLDALFKVADKGSIGVGDRVMYVFKGFFVDEGGVYFESTESSVPNCEFMGEFVPSKVVREDVQLLEFFD
ncbi:hypothetical protein SUGI_1144030 [Cryptomeria japonica]|nr:hypothetical protein SUGI_1144030 [Cryptomeria japonica]